MITYRIEPADPAAHRWAVTLEIPAPAAQQTVSLPVWIPGSYMVREFGRHLSGLQAEQGGQPRPLRQLDKTTWVAEADAAAGPLTLRYAAYAFDPSVRTAWLDTQRGFFNPTSLCLRVHGAEPAPHRVALAGLPRGWQVATAMAPVPGRRHLYQAADYDELADHPFELGPFWVGRFEACGVAHEFVVAGAWPGFDGERLLADTRRICEAQIRFWHGARGKAPFARYVFMLNAVEDGYGGLEHRASTALIAKRADLPRAGMEALPEGYLTLLGLISHEYFHTWNVKRLKPREFLQYDYTRENYTPLLWFFEGFTSYYDDLFLVRAGLLPAPRYLKMLAKTVNGVAGTPGQQVQSLAEASFDAWVKYYRPDENTPNSTVSYYTKGSLVALLLDLRLRAVGGSLDGLMRLLWKRCAERGLTEDEVCAEIARGPGGPALADELRGWVHARGPLPLAEALTQAGLRVDHEPQTGWAAALGLRVAEAGGVVQVKAVLAGSAAAQAGLSAGDEILAIDGWRVRRLEEARQWTRPGTASTWLLGRQQRLTECRLTPPSADDAASRQLRLRLAEGLDDAAQARRRSWLGA